MMVANLGSFGSWLSLIQFLTSPSDMYFFDVFSPASASALLTLPICLHVDPALGSAGVDLYVGFARVSS